MIAKMKQLEIKKDPKKQSTTKFFGIVSIILNIVGLIFAAVSIICPVLAPAFAVDGVTWATGLIFIIPTFIISILGAIIGLSVGLAFFITQISFNRSATTWVALGTLIFSWLCSLAAITISIVICLQTPIGV